MSLAVRAGFALERGCRSSRPSTHGHVEQLFPTQFSSAWASLNARPLTPPYVFAQLVVQVVMSELL